MCSPGAPAPGQEVGLVLAVSGGQDQHLVFVVCLRRWGWSKQVEAGHLLLVAHLLGSVGGTLPQVQLSPQGP